MKGKIFFPRVAAAWRRSLSTANSDLAVLAGGDAQAPIVSQVSSTLAAKPSSSHGIRYAPQWSFFVDSLATIKRLEKDGSFTREEAGAVHSCMADMLSFRFSSVHSRLITKQQVETDSFMLKAKCHEIKLDLQISSNKNAISRKALHEKSLLEIHSTIEKLRDSVDALQTDVKLRLNAYKAENREELSKIDSFLHQKTAQLTVLMSDIKTSAESVKVRLMYSFTSFMIIAFFFLIMEKNLVSSWNAKAADTTSTRAGSGQSQDPPSF